MCHEFLPLAAFAYRSKQTKRRQGHCKQCQRIYARQHYKEHSELHNQRRYQNHKKYVASNRQAILEYLSGKSCTDCGEADPVVLEFDHVRGDKRYDISRLLWIATWPAIVRELGKCVVRCANCHRRKTARDFKWFKAGGM